MEFLKNNRINILYVVVFLIYALTIFTTGFYHEPWADEAQAWLIARDNSFFDLFFTEPKYEGHPFIWFFILKFFMLTNIAPTTVMYEWIFLISCTFSCIGIYLLLFKSDMPILAKVLLPFTFFLCYQFPVIARNHSLVFPFLAIIACLYKKRFKRPYLYLSLLIITANISAYAFVIVSVMFAFFFFEVIKEKHNKIYLPVVATSILFLLSFLLMNKAPDSITTASFELSRLSIDRLLYMINNAFFNFNVSLFILEATLVLTFYFLCIKKFCLNTQDKLLFLGLNLPIPILLAMFTYRVDWHFGYIIIVLIFSCWLLVDKNKELKQIHPVLNFTFITLFLILSLTQIIWTIKCISYDINNKYCASKEIANYIKENNLTENKINAVGFKTVAIQPYFEKNIFANYTYKSYYPWKKEYNVQYLYKLTEKAPIYIVEKKTTKSINFLINYIDKNYDKKEFKGNIPSKGKIFEANSLFLYKNE